MFRGISGRRCVVTALVLLYFLRTCDGNDDEYSECDVDCQEDIGEVPLSRKKRAIVFPSGSSLQLGMLWLLPSLIPSYETFLLSTAYDQTMPIVAAQMLFTIGVTVALAFELPDKPLHHITEQLRENLQVRLHGPKTTEAPASNNANDNSRIDLNSNNLQYTNKQEYYNLMNKHSYYYGNQGFKDRIDDPTSQPVNSTNKDDVISKQVVKT